jgi:hypothetical protein
MTDYYLCHPKSDALFLRAKSAAVTVRSTQTISCGDGSGDDCLREDTTTERQISSFVDNTDLWRYFDQAPALKADLIVRFSANNRAGSDARILLQIQDSDSGVWLYSESRTITDIENDVNKLIDHFIAKSGRPALRSTEETEKQRQCTFVADQINVLQVEYKKKRSDYDFKNSHTLDAQMDECNLHWKEWVCLKRGGSDGLVSYAKEWNESGQELQRKLALEYEELKKLEQQLARLNENRCASQ